MMSRKLEKPRKPEKTIQPSSTSINETRENLRKHSKKHTAVVDFLRKTQYNQQKHIKNHKKAAQNARKPTQISEHSEFYQKSSKKNNSDTPQKNE